MDSLFGTADDSIHKSDSHWFLPIESPTNTTRLFRIFSNINVALNLIARKSNQTSERFKNDPSTIKFCNSLSPPLSGYCLLWNFLYGLPLKVFKTRMLGRDFLTLIRNLFSNQCGISQSTSLGAPASSLAHRPVSGSHTICNSLSPPLADVVLFGLSLSGYPSRF